MPTNGDKPWWQRRRFRVWASGLLSAVVHGAAIAGGSFITLATANGIGIDVPQLQLKQLGAVLLAAGGKEMFDYLKDHPLPSPEDDTAAAEIAPLKGNTTTTQK